MNNHGRLGRHNRSWRRQLEFLSQEEDLDYFIDIGANIGGFILPLSKKNPSAKIIGYEPTEGAFFELKKNIESIADERKENISIIKAALADGKPRIITKGFFGGQLSGHVSERNHLVTNDSWEGTIDGCPAATERIETKTLKQIIKENQIDLNKKIAIKIDCECSERFLLNEESLEILKHMSLIDLEAHYLGSTGNVPCENALEWSTYDNWVHQNFDEKHFEISFELSRKNLGNGHYFIKKLNK